MTIQLVGVEYRVKARLGRRLLQIRAVAEKFLFGVRKLSCRF